MSTKRKSEEQAAPVAKRQRPPSAASQLAPARRRDAREQQMLCAVLPSVHMQKHVHGMIFGCYDGDNCLTIHTCECPELMGVSFALSIGDITTKHMEFLEHVWKENEYDSMHRSPTYHARRAMWMSMGERVKHFPLELIVLIESFMD